MKSLQAGNKQQTYQEVIKYDSCNDVQAKNNRQRMKQFKRLSLRKNSFVEHLLSCHINQQIKQLSATQLPSYKQDLKPISQQNDKKFQEKSCRFDMSNPFFQAKQNYMSKQKASGSAVASQKQKDEPNVELADDKTTFRLIKRRSLNEVVVNVSNKQKL